MVSPSRYLIADGVDMSPDIVRESVSNQGKCLGSEFFREVFLCGDAWDTQKHLHTCLSIGPPGRIC